MTPLLGPLAMLIPAAAMKAAHPPEPAWFAGASHIFPTLCWLSPFSTSSLDKKCFASQCRPDSRRGVAVLSLVPRRKSPTCEPMVFRLRKGLRDGRASMSASPECSIREPCAMHELSHPDRRVTSLFGQSQDAAVPPWAAPPRPAQRVPRRYARWRSGPDHPDRRACARREAPGDIHVQKD